MGILAKALQDDADFNLGLTLCAGTSGLDRTIDHERIQKPGLAIAGLAHNIEHGRVQVLGNTELEFLASLSPQKLDSAATDLFSAGVACVVITGGGTPLPILSEQANASSTPLFCTSLTSGTFIARVHEFLDEHLSPEVMLHGVLVDVFGVGVLLTGSSGIGKSECALDLILRGHRLISDDAVQIRRYDRQLVGVGSPLTRHHMEVRGLGIINVRDLFGAASVCDRKRIELVVEMMEWEQGAKYDRLGIDDAFECILATEVPKVRIPLRPGRNVASILEVAARNHLLKLQGHHSAREFKETLERRLAEAAASFAAGDTR